LYTASFEMTEGKKKMHSPNESNRIVVLGYRLTMSFRTAFLLVLVTRQTLMYAPKKIVNLNRINCMHKQSCLLVKFLLSCLAYS
jgi:hypothetical protein